MSSITKFSPTNPDRGLFSQIAMFSLAGLSLSLALAFTCDLQVYAQWL
jgi:hypothetical protein